MWMYELKGRKQNLKPRKHTGNENAVNRAFALGFQVEPFWAKVAKRDLVAERNMDATFSFKMDLPGRRLFP